ncbi:HNH endonuclease [Nocardioides sp. J54]|uniref:HNH endonuclease n=1 Tax=Nocardioides sp. J54 TaxID=935866 RepID=UPI0004B98B93|nr:HNH endonuclease signature motif containing protein [Nocardioides sp. J54]
MSSLPTTEQVREWRDQLAGEVEATDAGVLVDLVAALEDLKSAAAAAQARATAAFDARRRAEQAAAGTPAARQGRGIASEVALARKESPHRGQVLLGLAKTLVTEMPHTLARLGDGSLSEFRVMLLARETACLQAEQRAFVDEELCADPAALAGVGTRELVGRARRMGAELDPAALARRARRAEADRQVTIRPAPDTMAWVTALLPVAQAVAVHATLRRDADAARADGDPRSRGQLMADLLHTRTTGAPDTGTPDAAPAVPLTIDLVMADTALAGGHAPAEVVADGVVAEVVPAEVARLLVSRALAADAAVWFRQLYRNRLGRLVAMTSVQRTFPRSLATFLAIQGHGTCATPWCDAPVRHTDHVTPFEHGGATAATNGQGLCEACNHAKQAPGWRQEVISPPVDRPEVRTVTPTGHAYTATAPPPAGWREPRFVQVGQGRYGLIA